MNKPFIIVFDDCHLIYNESILKFIENLVMANLENLSVFVLSKTNLTMNYIDVTDKTKIAYIDTQQLSFTYEEIKEYFENQNIRLSEDDLNQILKQTEGWPFAIYLISLHIKKTGR